VALRSLFSGLARPSSRAAGEIIDPRDIASIGAQLQEALRPSFTTGSGDSERENEAARETLLGLIARAGAAQEFEADAALQNEEAAAGSLSRDRR
jgi:hypothetical protein